VKPEESKIEASAPLRFVSVCYGSEFWAAVPGWARHIRKISDAPVDILSLDQQEYRDPAARISTIAIDVGGRHTWGFGDMARLALIAGHLERGTACVQMDIDVLLKRDVSPLLSLPYDFIVSRASAQPKPIAERMGFVACTGFYIAKPDAIDLCHAILSHAENNTYDSDLDQIVLNNLLLEAKQQNLWNRRDIAFDHTQLSIDEFECFGCRIAVLPSAVIQRNADLGSSLFGNHHRDLLGQFIDGSQTAAQ
jgi:hypothetical protein